ncbi:hypothetical protein [Desulfosarcina ovata]|uniref:Uncharacterized protein n=1 Tax=Desulfosarcina ovata subsp. ovata TaxID=2752305 RepID=A0A5K8A347_9BACT|nr:hypothetical protein [Desulfosarcina ovata]BBO86871.1 hypothetical protein DSCOOX_00510 [Desulfosarcina ovata subsp. ovata]
MIIDRPKSHFIFVLPTDHVNRHYNYIQYNNKPLTNREYLKYWGKWIIFGNPEELAALAKRLDFYVEKKRIPAVKYDRKEIPEFEFGQCVMCVYCDVRQRTSVWTILSNLGIKDKAWVYEKETVDRWRPGGYLLETWISSRKMDEEMAQKVRNDAENTFKQMFENENAVFRGIVQ